MSPLAIIVAGQGTVGETVSSQWFPGTWRITQGWGPVELSLEPAGHGYPHWHAGVDLGLACGTVLTMPHGLTGTARWIDNPGGYGTALRIELTSGDVLNPARQAPAQRTFDVWLGHLRQRLVPDGTKLHGGEQLAISNNTGYSTGCHLHFEVRPAGARYGTDVDPGSLLFIQGSVDLSQSSSTGNPYNDLDPRHAIWDLQNQISGGITSAGNTLLGVGQAGLGTSLLLGGLVIVTFGLRGRNAGQLQTAARATLTNVRARGARATYQRESAQQGEVARDVAEQTAEQRAAAAERAGIRKNTMGAYRAGLISRQTAQQRLGEPIRATGKRSTRVAYSRGGTKPGTYRWKGQGVDVKDPRSAARRSRVRVSHQRDFTMPPARPVADAGEIPF
jgi:hypothetical protein